MNTHRIKVVIVIAFFTVALGLAGRVDYEVEAATTISPDVTQSSYSRVEQNHDKVYQETTNDTYSSISKQLERIYEDDRSNPVCEYWEDGDGYAHGCLTDVQLDALNEIEQLIR